MLNNRPTVRIPRYAEGSGPGKFMVRFKRADQVIALAVIPAGPHPKLRAAKEIWGTDTDMERTGTGTLVYDGQGRTIEEGLTVTIDVIVGGEP